MQPFNSNINKNLEEVLQEVLIRDGNLVLPYFGSLQYNATTVQQNKEHLELKRNVVSFKEDSNTSANANQIETISRRLNLSNFESKVLLNRWLGNIKSTLRTKSAWSSDSFGEISSTEHGIKVLLNKEAFNNQDYTYFGFASVTIPKPLLKNDSITINKKEEVEPSKTKIIAIDKEAGDEHKSKEKIVAKQVAQPVGTSARALAASFILGVVTLSLFSFEGNRVGSPVYNMLHPVQQASHTINEQIIEAHSLENTLDEQITESKLDQVIAVEAEGSETTPNNPEENTEVKDEMLLNDKATNRLADAKVNNPEVYVVLGSFSQKENAYRAINEFESINLADQVEYKFNGTYYRVGIHISEDKWHEINKEHGLSFWILQ